MPAGLIFDKYEVLRRLAVGGMGEIYLARQTGVAGFDRLVILKGLLPELAEEQRAIDEFLDEARVAATFLHPNIVQIYEVGKWQGIYFIAMEYVPGDNLFVIQREAQRAGVRFPVAVSARILHDAALGLDYAHNATDTAGRRLNVVHRDISPQNIMVTTSGVTKLVDFGIATSTNRESRTRTGIVKGKLAYMAPEQIVGAEIDPRTDQFALGAVAWELLTGRRIFKAKEGDLATAQNVMKAQIQPPSRYNGQVSPQLEQIVMRMLSKERQHRFGGCAEVARALEEVLKGAPTAISTEQIGTLVDGLIGDKIRERMQESKSEADNFLVSFGVGAPKTEENSVAVSPQRPDPPARKLPEWTPSPQVARPMGEAVAAPRFSITAYALAGLLLFALTVGLVVLVNPFKEVELETPARPAAEPQSSQSARGAPASPLSAPALTLTTNPTGAKVFFGGKELGKTPLETNEVPPGSSRLALQLDGYKRVDIDVELVPGIPREIHIPLAEDAPEKAPSAKPPEGRTRRRPPAPAPKPAPVASGEGSLSVSTEPWAKVFVDGKAQGTTPLFRLPLSAGSHSVRLTNEEAKIDTTRKVTIKPGETTKLSIDLRKK